MSTRSHPAETDEQRAARVHAIVNDCLLRRSAGEVVTDDSIIEAHPELMPELAEQLRNLRMIQEAERQFELPPNSGLRVRCPHCHNPVEILDDMQLSDVLCTSCGSHFSLVDDAPRTFQASDLESVGHFKLLDKIGVGAYGSVWSARDTQLDRQVAVKIPRKTQMSAADTEQFIREARAAAQLSHPNIVRVHEVGREGDRVYIVTDFVRGLDLADWLTDQQATPREAAELCATLADALDHAHQQGVIHRDLKPSNIMLDTSGQPHLMDFGLAKREAGEITMTVEGKLLGTPAYMSPEQARGDAHGADARSDVYSLGVILFELLTGERPFRGSTRMLLHQVLVEDAPSPRKLNPSVPRDLGTICLKCLEKDPSRRYQTAGEMRDDLKHFLAGEPVQARPITRAARAWRWSKRKPVVAGLGLTVTCLLVFLAVAGPIVAMKQKSLADREARAHLEAQRARVDVQKEADRNRRLLYSSDMQIAQSRLNLGDINGVVSLLERHYPATDEEDLRGWGWYYLWRKCQRAIMTPAVQTGGREWQISFSSDGKTMTTTNSDAIRKWNVSTREMTSKRMVATTGREDIVTLSLDGRMCAIGHEDGTVTLEDLVTDQRRQFSRLATMIMPLEFSPDGTILAAGALGGSVGIWKVDSGNALAAIEPHGDRVYSLAFSPNGKVFASGSRDGTAKLWDVESGQLLKNIDHRPPLCKKKSSVWSMAFSPDGETLATGTSGDHLVMLWNVENGQLIHKISSHTNYVRAVAFSPDGEILASSSGDNQVKLWDVDTGNLKDTINSGATSRSMAFSPDGSILACHGPNGVVRLWPLDRSSNNDLLEEHKDNVYGVTFSPDGKTLASASEDKTVIIWDVATGAMRFPPLEGHDALVSSVRFSPTGDTLSSLSIDGTLRLWRTSTGQLIETFPHNGISTTGRALGQAFSPSGELIAVGRPNGTVTVWNLQTRESTTFTAHEGSRIFSIEFAPDGRSFATSSQSVKIWDIESLEMIRQLPDCGGWPLAYSPNGLTLAAGSAHFEGITLWDLVHDKEIWSEWQDEPNSLVFTPDGSRIICVGGQGPVQFRDTTSGDLRFSLAAHRDAVYTVAISPDGRTLATGSADDTVKLWRTATGEEVERMRRRWSAMRE